MKVLHIVSGSLSGGAARGAMWLHKALKKSNIDSTILTNSINNLNDSSIIEITDESNNRNTLEKQILYEYPNKLNFIFSTGFFGFDFKKLQIFKDADIIHLHWINGNFIDISHLKAIKKPIIWTLRDMWPMTGGCHYSFDCKKYKKCGCQKCPQLKSNKKKDLSYWIFEYKKYNIPNHIQIVGISNWIAKQAKKSILFKEFPIKTIFNNIDTTLFKVYNKSKQKKFFNLPQNKIILLFGANNIQDPYKGFEKLQEVVKLLPKENYFLSIFGNADEDSIKQLGIEYKLFGKINDDKKLNKIYSSADIFLALSTHEAFGKTLVESMSSGTPVVCFDSTGPKDIIEHKIDGYKARPFDCMDVLEGIQWLQTHYKITRDNAIKHSRKKFDNTVIAKQYIRLYTSLLDNFNISNCKSDKKSQSINLKINYIKDALLKNNKQIFENNIRLFYNQLNDLSNMNYKYVIYGNGTIGKTIQALIPDKIVGYVDIADKNNHPRNLINMKYDKIIISVLGREEEIIKYLVEDLKIARDKIITLEV